MRKGYLNLLQNLKLLTQSETAKQIDFYELHTATGRTIRVGEVIVGTTDIYAKAYTDPIWHQLPNDELVGYTVSFALDAKIQDLPALIANKGRMT